MNETNAEHERIERLLKQAHVPAPSNQLRERITDSARQAWKRNEAETPWRVPLRRLALSAVAAVIIISLTNHLLLVTQMHLTKRLRGSAGRRNARDYTRDCPICQMPRNTLGHLP